jgi:hypothetical protein
MREGRIVNIRKLVALDIALHGWRFITMEFIFGVFGIAVIGLLTIPVDAVLGWYMMLISLNYVPTLIYAVIIGNRVNAKKETKIELSNLRRYGPKYGFQQLMIFVPFAIIALSVVQEYQKR